MQITFNSHYEFNLVNQASCKKVNFLQNYSMNSFLLPNYHQVDKSLVNFCGKKYKTSLESYLGGYQKEKITIDNILITPLNDKSQLPPSLLLAFPDNHTQMQTMQGIIQTSDADFVTASSSDENLCDNLRKILADARENYQRNGRQTVIIIDEAEKAIGMTPAYAKELSLIPLSEEDFNYLNSNGTNLKKVNFFKSLLDNVNKISSNANDSKSPVTILFTTKKPQYIHPDIITRDGKMKTVILPIPYGKNAKNSISYETEKIKDKLSELMFNNEGLSKSQVKQLEIMRTSGKLKDLSIDTENIPFQKIMSYTAPNKKNGAYSNKKYQEIALKSLKDYISQPKTPYSIHFVFNLTSAKRDISPIEYQEYESMRCLFGK